VEVEVEVKEEGRRNADVEMEVEVEVKEEGRRNADVFANRKFEKYKARQHIYKSKYKVRKGKKRQVKRQAEIDTGLDKTRQDRTRQDKAITRQGSDKTNQSQDKAITVQSNHKKTRQIQRLRHRQSQDKTRQDKINVVMLTVNHKSTP
jgi:hypothetical protein